MNASDLDRKAKLRATIRSYIADLRQLGVDDERIGRCKNIYDLDCLKKRTLDDLMAAPRTA